MSRVWRCPSGRFVHFTAAVAPALLRAGRFPPPCPVGDAAAIYAAPAPEVVGRRLRRALVEGVALLFVASCLMGTAAVSAAPLP